MLNGQGERRTPNGEVYTGTWVDGKLTGPGTMTSPMGKYTGNFVDNQEHGYGSMVRGSKFVSKRYRCGRMVVNTTENGKEDFLMDKEFSLLQMANFTKDNS